ncbi:TetR/AcrR family transcriptional regulator [Actinomadura macrotermitis]|uniref:HTH-type transcriptional repressor n=1 Tax=Actinomadura macrotermitis TaxID=2585200 RepID=A0A7K0BMS3_9ACTN|nr:TetR family transcriptional regulator [Actinomadura macrotermitis]MQY02478.1 HTH-type transcriptional repressor [Actinomadura macrotermitis]
MSRNDAASTRAASTRVTSTRVASTKEALLHAARDEFAEHGVAGARVDRIARRAGVNKERIYGYFGNKEKLFDAVMKLALDEFAEVTASPADDPAEYVGRLFDYYREHPSLLRLLSWEALQGRDMQLPEQQWRMDLCQGKRDALAASLGHEPSDEDGRLLLTLKALAMMPMAMPQLATLLGVSVDDPGSAAAMREHVMAFARSALENSAAAARP